LRKFIFEKSKYGFELLMDLHKFEANPNVFFDPNPQTTNFFEIMIFEKANGRKKCCMIDLSGIKGFHLVFQSDFLSDFFGDKLFTYRLQYFYNSQHPQFLQLKNDDYTFIRLALNEIIVEIKNYQNDSSHILRSLLYFSLSKLNRLYSKCYNISPNIQSNSIIYKFKELLELNIRNSHTVEEYCNLLNVTRHQLNTMVKNHTRYTTKEIISNRLLLEIKTELRYSDKTISEIAHDLNFSEPNNLTRFFIKMENINPSDYRKIYQNDNN